MNSIQTEHRKFVRFIPEERTFVVFRPEFIKLGKIKDISLGGLGYEYIVQEHMNNNSKDSQITEIDILLSETKFHMSKIPCKMVYDMQVSENIEDNSINNMETRHCGLQFGDLTGQETKKLESFLNNNVAGTA